MDSLRLLVNSRFFVNCFDSTRPRKFSRVISKDFVKSYFQRFLKELFQELFEKVHHRMFFHQFCLSPLVHHGHVAWVHTCFGRKAEKQRSKKGRPG